ncbi:GNAT family acetyltransferase [Chloroflexota bacterium]
MKMTVRPYSPGDENAVLELWRKCNLTRPWNNPKLDIERKLKVNPELFLVGLVGGRIIATVIGGYDGHRGWIQYLAVAPDYQRRGLGSKITKAVEEKILGIGCPKINLQIRAENAAVVAFYESIGYQTEDIISMGKRLAEDE